MKECASTKSANESAPAVLHLNTEKTWRGGEQQMLYLALGLHRRGFQTAVVSERQSPCSDRVREAGLRCHELHMRGEWDLWAARDIARIAREGGYDILHAHTSHAHTLGSLAARIFDGAARMVVHRRVDFHIHPHFLRLGAVKYRLGVDRIIAISRPVKEVLISDGVPADKIEIIPSAVKLSRFENIEPDPGLRDDLGIPEDAVFIINVGYLVGHKAHEYLIRAAPRVLEEVPDAYFVIAGSGPRLEELQEEARRESVESRVIFAGFRSDVPELLAEADMFALSSWGEGLCSTLLEVMASDLPIVATAAGGVTDVIEDGYNGILVPTRDPEALADGIIRMASDPALAQRMVENARHVVREKFSAKSLVDSTLELYRRLLSARRI
ncbi:MAG: glycosyltransferase family 4 protein [Planctomycetes bacterium]|nr:glycosyltransferase family 4 protein [Planctomycetota bacterium]